MEKFIYGLIAALIAAIFFLAYNNPKGYEALKLKLIKWCFDAWGGICTFGLGVHFTFWQFNLPIEEDSFYSYVLPNFSYIWGSALILLFVYFSFAGLGRLLGDLKNQESEKNS